MLIYSGGLDTPIIIPQLEESHNSYEVVAVSTDVGQGTELGGFEEKAIKTDASELYILDLKDESVGDYIYPCLKADAIREDVYLLGTALTRPLIGQKLVGTAKQGGADAICHGCAGKGNDQVRSEPVIKAFAPDMPTIVPWRTRELKSGDDEIDYAEAHSILLKISRETNYSKDKNLWHLSHEELDLGDPMNESRYDDILEMGITPKQVPDTPIYITLTFGKGILTASNGEKLGGQVMVTRLNEIGGADGIGVTDMVEDRLMRMKSRGVYETSNETTLCRVHQRLESIYLDKETMYYEQGVGTKFGEILCNGQWFIPLHKTLSAFVDKTNETVSGEVKVKLYKGNFTPASISSLYTLYSEQIASFGEGGSHNQSDPAGFTNLYGLPTKVKATMDEERKK